LVVTPSSAVTTTAIPFSPDTNSFQPLARPEATVTPFTVITERGWAASAVTSTAVTVSGTRTVYCVVSAENAGERLPALSLRLERSATAIAGRRTSTV
jgi:hypothetical protein